MTVKSKTALGRISHKLNPPKKTRQGNGAHSKPRGLRKLSRGQGR